MQFLDAQYFSSKMHTGSPKHFGLYLQRGLGTAYLDSGGFEQHQLWFGSSGSWNWSCTSAGLSLCLLSFTSALARHQPLPVS